MHFRFGQEFVGVTGMAHRCVVQVLRGPVLAMRINILRVSIPSALEVGKAVIDLVLVPIAYS